MSASDYQHHANEGVYAFHAGRFRESADHYWQAFDSMPRNNDYRYHILHGCTTILRDDHFECTDEDFNKIRRLFHDKSEARLFRLEAAFTLAIMHYARQERSKCEEVYHHAISIGEKKLKDKDAKKEERFQHISKGENMEKKSMKELTEGLLNDCKQNLEQLNSPKTTTHAVMNGTIQDIFTLEASRSVFNASDNPKKIGHEMPIGRGGTRLTDEMINNLINVGGNHCDYCKQNAKKLLVCSVCRKGFYCSKECQTKQYHERDHKQYCRKEGQFKVGDLVQLARLKNKPELNGRILRVVGRDTTSTEERYKVQMEGAVKGDKTISVKPENLNQMRPYDCRI